MSRWPRLLEPEEGSTRVSLENASKLLKELGLPDVIHLYWDPQLWYVTEAWWGNELHKFTGFSWGYTGEGPRGLLGFFKMIGMDPSVNIKEIGSWPEKLRATESGYRRWTRGGLRHWRPERTSGIVFWKGVHYGR